MAPLLDASLSALTLTLPSKKPTLVPEPSGGATWPLPSPDARQCAPGSVVLGANSRGFGKGTSERRSFELPRGTQLAAAIQGSHGDAKPAAPTANQRNPGGISALAANKRSGGGISALSANQRIRGGNSNSVLSESATQLQTSTTRRHQQQTQWALQPKGLTNLSNLPDATRVSSATRVPNATWSLAASAGGSGAGDAGGGGAGDASRTQTDPKVVRTGSLVEFERDRSRMVVGVVVGTQGKKLMVVDQFGTSFPIRPQQITFSVLPGNKMTGIQSDDSLSYQPADLVAFVAAAQKLLDDSLLQLAWEEASESGEMQGTSVGGMAQILFGQSGPIECYACHKMLSSDTIYFRRRKGPEILYEPRPADQVSQLRAKAEQESAAKELLTSFSAKSKAAYRAAWKDKPSASDWKSDSYAAPRIEAVTAYALEKPLFDRQLVEEVLQVTNTPANPAAALDLLIALGVLPRHINTHLLQAALPLSFPPEIEAAAAALAANPPPDPDKDIRKDLSHLKVYMIDSADTVEVDDGLSAETLSDGRTKVWVHIADPTRWISLGSLLDMDARGRGTSVYLPTHIIPMIPFTLAAGPMSLDHCSEPNHATGDKQGAAGKEAQMAGGRAKERADGKEEQGGDEREEQGGESRVEQEVEAHTGSTNGASVGRGERGQGGGSLVGNKGVQEGRGRGKQCAISIGVVLRDNGSVQEYEIVPSYIYPTYRLTFEEVPEMMAATGTEEGEMHSLIREAQKRLNWRQEQGCMDMFVPESEVKVKSPDSPDPEIALTIVDQSHPIRRLVSELMILCGEVVADFGNTNGIPLPYRGQQAPEISEEAEQELRQLAGIPLAHSAHMRLCMTKSSINCRVPVPHAALGLPGYVQFSSPIRRYGDLLAHYQMKAVLRGEAPPLAPKVLERLMLHVAGSHRVAKKVESATVKYWVLEFLRRLPPRVPLRAVMLRWVKQDTDSIGLIHLTDIGLETTIRATRKLQLGEEIAVSIMEVSPRKNVLRLVETLLEEKDEAALVAQGVLNR